MVPMSEIKITLPKLGESIVSATIVQWFKQVGDSIALDESLLEVSTDKVNSEIPSPVAGVLKEIYASVGQELAVGAPLALIATQGTVVERVEQPKAAPPSIAAQSDFVSPSVIRALQEKNIPLSEMGKIPHTGEGGRLTRKDVENYKGACDKTERLKMSPLRKAIADNMVRSFYEAPHASLITEVDVTEVMQKIRRDKQSFLEQYGVKLTITAFVARAITRALRAYPLINASLDGDTVVVKKFVNLGIAVSVDQGVMVPVIRGAEGMGIPELSKQINLLAEKARNQTLAPNEVQEGSITMTNFGMTGTMIGIPIIRFPEVAIVGLGAVTKKVAAMPDDTMAIRQVCMVSLTFDHRVLDGLYGCGFLNDLKRHLETDLEL